MALSALVYPAPPGEKVTIQRAYNLFIRTIIP